MPDPAESFISGALSAAEPEPSVPKEVTPAQSFYQGAVGQFLQDYENQSAPPQPTAAKPKTWFGELSNAVARGTDQLQQTAYGAGAYAADVAKLDGLKNFFIKGYEQQNEEIADNPESVPTRHDIDGFDSFMRYAISSTGQFLPQVAESAITGALGAAAGSGAAPGPGTIAGGIGGFVERQAVRNIIKGGVEKMIEGAGAKAVKNELLEYTRGKIAKESLQDITKGLLVNETKNILGKYGATTAIGLNSVATETASIYGEMTQDPNIPESDRKLKALLGGIVAAIPDTAFEGWIASKFFKGATNVPSSEIKQAQGFLVKFTKEYGGDILKATAGGAGEEAFQTIAEEAAKNWARPDKESIFEFSPEQREAVIESAIRGGLGEGALGGAAIAASKAFSRPHPNPEVRAIERDIMGRASDLTPDTDIVEGEDDVKLSAIGKRRAEIEQELSKPDLQDTGRTALQTELAQLDASEQEILGAEESLVNENQQSSVENTGPTPAQPLATESVAQGAEGKKTPVRTPNPLERAVGHLRALYAQEMPSRSVYERDIPDIREKLESKRAEVTSLVNEIQGKDSEYADQLRANLTDDVLTMFAAEDVLVRHATETDKKERKAEGFSVFMQDDGSIVLTIPTTNEIAKRTSLTADPAQALVFTPETVPDILAHEIIHVADQVSIRGEWLKNDSGISLHDYEARVMEERGRAIHNALPKVRHLLNRAYNPHAQGGAKFRTLGQEFTRMLVELARTGKINEVTDAINQAALEEKAASNTHGVVSKFLAKWIDALTKIHASLKKMLNPKEAPPELIQAYDAINKTLDKYGVLVNERDKAEQAKVVSEREGATSEAGSTRPAPKAPAPDFTIGQIIANNAKVEQNGVRGRLVNEGGTLVLRTPASDFVVSQNFNPETKSSELGVRVLKPSKIKEVIQEVQDIIADSDQADVQAVLTENPPAATEPAFVRDAKNHPLLNDLFSLVELGQSKEPRKRKTIQGTPEYRRMIREVSDSTLNRAENIVVNTLERIEQLDMPEDRRAQLMKPFEDLWEGIETLRQLKTEETAKQEQARLAAIQQTEKEDAERQAEQASREVQPILPATPIQPEGITESEVGLVTAEVVKPKARRTVSKEDQAKQKLEKAIASSRKAGNVATAIQAHIDYQRSIGEAPDPRAFKAMYGKGATIKLYKEIADLGAKQAARSIPASSLERQRSKVESLESKAIQLRDTIDRMRNDEDVDPIQLAAAEDELRQTMAQAEAEEQALRTLVNERSAAKARPYLSERETKEIAAAIATANRISNQAYTDLQTKESEVKRRAGEIPMEGAVPMDLYYTTQPHTASTNYAQALVNETNALDVAEKLESDPEGKQFGITEDEEGMDFGPNSRLRAVYENVIRQLASITKNLRKGDGSIATLGYLNELRQTLENRMRGMGTAAGQFNAYTGMSEKLWTAESARREYVDTLTEAAERVIGKDAKAKMRKLAKDLNELWKTHVASVVNSPKLIAAIRKMHRLVNEKKFEKGYRQTIVKNIDKLKAIVNGAAARAVDHMSMDEDGEAYAQKAAERIVSEMTGMPKAEGAPSELQIFQSAIQKVARTVGKEMGLISESPKQTKAGMQQQFSIILKNEGLYGEFSRALYEGYVKEYGGANPSEAFMDEASLLFARLSNRMWTQGMVNSLVNEKLREVQDTFAKIAREHFSVGETKVERIRNDIAEYLKTQGVENQGLVDQLTQDIQDSMRQRIEIAREKFFTSSPGIRDFLRKMQTTLSQAAKEHSTYVDSVEAKFEEALENYYGIPNTEEFPFARQLAALMQRELNQMVVEERKRLVQAWVKSATKDSSETVKSKALQTVDKILQLANAGALRQEDVYIALQDKFNLPRYSEETARQIEQMGDMIAESKSDRQKDRLKQELANFITQEKGLKTSDAFVSWMYLSMLSGPGTQLVNIGGNFTNLMGYVMVEAIKNPSRIPTMLRALVRAATGVGQLEAREAFFDGMALGKDGQKWFSTVNPLELSDPFFKSSLRGKGEFYDKVAQREEDFAKFVHKIGRGVRGQYVGRALMATDMFFYKIAQEMAYTARVGEQGAGTPEMWEGAMNRARADMLAIGQNPDDSKDSKRRQIVLAHSIYSELRLRDENGLLVNERETAWKEANVEALDATFNSEPKYFLGYLAKHIERFTNDKPVGKLIIPFTRIAANVTNAMLEWTPYGVVRYSFETIKEGGNPFKLIEDGKWKRESDIALRSMLGMAAMITIMAMAGDSADDDDPFFTVYADGPRDLTAKRQLQERGWKPNTIKVGGQYYGYNYTPLAMAMSIVGRHFDDYRDGRIASPTSLSMSSSAVALVEAVKNQSFLATAADLMASVDSPNPQDRLSRVFARFATIPIPNLIKQIDRVVDPTLQQADGFWETFLKEFPVARHLALDPALNVFGEPITRTASLMPFPGLDRFVTEQRSDDPVFNLLGEKRIVVPGFSKSTRIGDRSITEAEYYQYVQEAGPIIKKRISAELLSLDSMSREDAQERIDDIASEEKKKVRDRIRAASR